MYFLVKDRLASFACFHEVQRESQLQVSERAKEFAVNRLRPNARSSTEKRKRREQTGSRLSSAFSLRLRGLLV
jgi:hypothetical protein